MIAFTEGQPMHRPTALVLLVFVGLAGCKRTPTQPPVDPEPPTTTDQAPSIGVLSDQATVEGETVELAVSITDEDPGSVTLIVTSSNLNVVDLDELELTGAGADRTLTLSPPLGGVGTSEISVTATDSAGQTAMRAFSLSVAPMPPPTGPFGWSARLTSTGERDSGAVGQWVDVSGDFIAAGSLQTSPDAVTVFRRTHGSWAQVWSTSIAGGNQGVKVAIEDDVVMAARVDETLVYERTTPSGEEWVLTDTIEGGFGLAINRNRVLVTNGELMARVHTRLGPSWNESSTIAPQPEVTASDGWGRGVALDGNVAVIGAPLDDASGSDAGAAWVYRFDGAGWAFEQVIRSTDLEAGDAFGREVAVSGNRIVVGAPLKGDMGLAGGAAYVFEYDGTTWSQSTRLDINEGGFGGSVDVQGSEIIVGAPFKNSNGLAYHFVLEGDSWTRTFLGLSSQQTNMRMAFAVAIDDDTVVLGAPADDQVAVNAGAVHVFVR